MACSPIYVNMQGQLDEIEKSIETKFENLISSLIGRKLELISKVKLLRTNIYNKEIERNEILQNIEKLEKVLASMKVNKLEVMHDNISLQIQEQRKQLELDEKEQGVVTLFCNTNDLLQKISNLGIVIEKVIPKYSVIKQPVISIGKVGSSIVFCHPTGLALDEDNERIFVVDSGNHKIQVYSFECEFIQDFDGKRLKEPWGIAVNKNNLYVTDLALHTVIKYDCTSHPVYVKSLTELSSTVEEQLRKPQGITVDPSNEEVYVTDTKLNTVFVYSSDLILQRKLGYHLVYPSDVKVHQDYVYVLDFGKPSMHKYNKAGCLISDIHLLNDANPIDSSFLFFSIDCMGNFLISNWKNDIVFITHPDGDVFSSIVSDSQTGTVLKSPKGVAVTRSGRIVVISDTHKNWIQIF